MPELPEVQTTVNGLKRHIIGLTIKDVWSNYNSDYFKGSDTIKDRDFFKKFHQEIIGSKVISAERRAKNILIGLNNGKIILVHMKMTGHLLFGRYEFKKENKKDPWLAIEPEALKDPYNRHVRMLIAFTNGKHLALSDVRRFAKVTLIDAKDFHNSEHVKNIGPEPLERSFTLEKFVDRLKLKPRGKIKLVLMDQSILAGIGNIYADESLWRAGIMPTRIVSEIKSVEFKVLYDAIKKTLSRGIDFGGDSTSDYRNVNGEKGKFHESHYAYQQNGKKCAKKGCNGIIKRIVIGTRSTHFCPVHQR